MSSINKIKLTKRILIFQLLFLLFLTFGQILVFSTDLNEVNSYSYLKLSVVNNIQFSVKFDSKYNIETFNLNSYFFPKTINNSQYLNLFKSNLNSNSNFDFYLKNESDLGDISFINFKLNKNSLKSKNNLNNLFIIESVKINPKIKRKIDFPVKNIDMKYKKYLTFSDLIDTNQKIRSKASQLASGEDDLYVISAKIAKWIQNDIDYDLKTALENPNQKSSDVFKSKKGVCKEITNLYVSMIRSLGIPARVVSGYAYTNSDELIKYLNSNWGGHAWAEVLIGNSWVPFDLTYNQYGYVDATHIILERTVDSRSNSVRINASGYGFDLVKNSLKINNSFKVMDKKFLDSDFNLYNIKLTGPTKLGFSSYGYLKVKVKNLKDYYQVLFLNLIKTSEIKLLDKSSKMLILAPNQEKEIYFKYKLPENLDPSYEYTFPFTIENEFIHQSLNISVNKEFPIIKKLALPKQLDKKNNYSSNKLDISCSIIPLNDKNNILCSIKNNNNYNVDDLIVCLNYDGFTDNLNKNCKYLDLNINNIKQVNFDLEKFSKLYKLNYKYSYYIDNKKNNISGSINLNLPKPDLNFSINLNKLKFVYHINNYFTGLKLKFINSKNHSHIYNLTSENGSFNLSLKNGKNYFKIYLLFSNSILFEKNIVVDYNLSSFNDSKIQSNKNFLLDYLFNLFMLFKSWL